MGTDVVDVDAYVEAGVINAPLYTSAVVFPFLAFISWIICIPPMVWHFQQSNVAMGSFILWIVLLSFFNSINPLIWPRDNLIDWWDGSVWCDIQVRLQVGCGVGLALSSALIVRKLAKVMDTSNITVSSSRSSKTKERIWEAVWCWGAPLLLMIVYYVIQPTRYMIYSIVGCIATYDTSWPSIAIVFIWAPVAMCFAAYWATLLVYRLYRYRRDFHRLVTARNTTTSRFVRLFILSMVVILIYLVYSFYLLVQVCLVVKDPYSWSTIHNPARFNTIIRVPMHGRVQIDKWIQVVTGFVIFALFGTGVDAHNLYKRMLVSIGAGKIWPSLHEESQHGSHTPSSFIAARSWTESVSNKAKSMLSSSKTDATRDTFSTSTRNGSVALDAISHLHSTTTEDTVVRQKHNDPASPDKRPSFFKRWFATPYLNSPILLFFSRRHFTTITAPDANRSPAAAASSSSPGVHAQAWAAQGTSSGGRASVGSGVHVSHEIHQARHEMQGREEDGSSIDALV